MSKFQSISSINDYVEICRKRFISLGYNELVYRKIVVRFDTRAYKRLGQCAPKWVNGEKIYYLSFNKKYCEIGADINVENTIAHEVAHCVDGGLSHEHSSNWYKAAQKYNQTFNGHITRQSSDDNYRAYLESRYQAKSKYLIYCKDCGKVVCTYERKTKAVTEISKTPYHGWKCGICGHTNLSVQIGQ